MKPLYVVAVSGGVDSMVLLDRLVRADEARLVVAHVDHGIRPESTRDATFVRTCTKMHKLPFETTRLELGRHASEERARIARWRYLRDIKAKYSADKIVTAHHADDVVETMFINMTRGTGWRGIATLRETEEIKRPLLALRKKEIIEYARAHEIDWREDATNQDSKYLRNRVRHAIIPRISDQQFDEFVRLHSEQLAIRDEIEREARAVSPALRRHEYVMWPDDVAREMLRATVGSLTRRECDQALLFIRTARPHKQLPLSNGQIVRMQVNQFIVSRGEDC